MDGNLRGSGDNHRAGINTFLNDIGKAWSIMPPLLKGNIYCAAWTTEDHRSALNQRQSQRIVIDAYEGLLRLFPTRPELLGAFMDVTTGIQGLHAHNTRMHCDVGVDNILVRIQGSNRARKGVIVDLDMVFTENHERNGIMTTRREMCRYKSMAILGIISDLAPAEIRRDKNLEDLESLFYVFVAVIFGFTADGTWLTHGR
ncbi:hypothetical protein BKA70DRAFT_1483375 [Coprinopsis sp. MPI-PUGE-AT-0042]|nr:hypothetical protein BKA70DRAFT_1483375 [Coprinopsis sp. MPI-PUGE-AT-0042]